MAQAKTFNEFMKNLLDLQKYMLSLQKKILKLDSNSSQYKKEQGELLKHIEYMGIIIDNNKNKFEDFKKKSNLVSDLVKLANNLDKLGNYALADKFTEVAALIKKTGMQVAPTNSGVISSRYCPDHVGVQLFRVAEGVYQCPLDGKQYNTTSGYVNYNGQKVPGGSVANQTNVDENNYGGVPMQFIDPSTNVLKPVH